MKKSTFNTGLKCANAKGWIVGGRGRHNRYNLGTTDSVQSLVQSSVRFGFSYEKTEPFEPTQLGWFEDHSNRLRTDEPSASCKNADATANGENLNAINEGDLVAKAQEQLEKARLARRSRQR